MELIAPWPKGLTRAAIRHCPAHLREDAIQIAWITNHEGRKPDSAVRALIRQEERQRHAKPDLDRCSTRCILRRF